MIKKIDGVVHIKHCGTYAKTPEALAELLTELKRLGYRIDNLREAKHENVSVKTMEKNGWSLWFASLDVRRGKCGSCHQLINTLGICSHGHKCEKCGAVTYNEFVDGTIINFRFINNGDKSEVGMLALSGITMKAKKWDAEAGYLYLYPEVSGGRWSNDEQAKESFQVNKNKWESVEVDGEQLIRVKYSKEWKHDSDAIEPLDIHGHYHNHEIVSVWEGKEYSEFGDRLPVPDMVSIYEAWHWAPLKPSPTLHEQIISAARMVSRCDYYYQDGRRAFEDVHLERMRLFVENFTTLNLKKWDKMISEADLSGPGMIRAIARFCHPRAVVQNNPNVGNLIVGLGKVLEGEGLTNGDLTAMADAARDPKESQIFLDIFGDPQEIKKTKRGKK